MLNGNVEALGFDALNLYALPKAGEVLASKIYMAADMVGSPILRASAPVIGRAFGMYKK